MSRVLLISLGQLNGHILEALSRTGDFVEIVVAGRDPGRGLCKTNLARIGAAIEGRYPVIRFVELDVNKVSAGAILRDIAPDVALAAPSMLPWWRLGRLTGRNAGKALAVPFAGWLACHLAPMMAVRRAWADSGLVCPWVGASYPDVVNVILRRTGPAPVCGVGNVDEIIPKVRFAIAAHTGCDPASVNVRLVAQHALEYFVYCDAEASPNDRPPFLLRAELNGRDLSNIARGALFTPYPIPYDLNFNLLTASSANRLLPALAGHGIQYMHVPAPNGLPGGYPVRVEAGRVSLDLANEWSQEKAVNCCLASLPWDGLAAIENDGTAAFTQAASQALHELTRNRYELLKPDQAQAMADSLLEAVGQ